jgi:hypothetical protein
MTIVQRDLERILERLRSDPELEPSKLDRVYRRLILQVHPDHREGDGELFLYLKQQFDTLREETTRRRCTLMLERDLDPYRIAVDLGITRDLEPREALYVALYRFRSLGLATWRVRVRPSLRERNSRIIRTVLYWGRRYDERFVDAFQELLRNPGQFLLAEHTAPLYFLVRRTMLRGMDGLIRFQDRGRPATASIARDTLKYALLLASSREGDRFFDALTGMVRWMLEELEKPALILRLH